MSEIYNFEVNDIDQAKIKLDEYKGKTILIVNVASACGFTPQYEGLQSMYEKYKDKGLEILAFPCNQFGGQESGTNEEIKISVIQNIMFLLNSLIKSRLKVKMHHHYSIF